jgi:hypothetical protein
MSALDRNPTNPNYQSPLVFEFSIKRAPNVNFFIQNVSLPGIMLDQVESPNPFVQIPHTGDHIYYEELGIQFKVAEDLHNWLEIHNWIKGTGFPDNYDQYKEIASGNKTVGLGLKSDLSLLIANSNKNLSIDVTFKDAFPISISALQFDTTSDDVPYLDAFAAFRYVSYDIRIL